MEGATAMAPAECVVGVVVDLAAGDRRDGIVEEGAEASEQAGLGLAALAEEDEVLAGEDGVLELRDDRFLVAEDALEEGVAGGEAAGQVAAQLRAHGPDAVLGATQLADGGRPGLCHDVHLTPASRGDRAYALAAWRRRRS